MKKQTIYLHQFENGENLLMFLEKYERDIKTVVIEETGFQGLDKELILKLKVRHPDKQIIYVFQDYQPEKEDFLLMWMVFDTVLSHNDEEIEQLIKNPRDFQAALNFIQKHGKHINCKYCEGRKNNIWYD